MDAKEATELSREIRDHFRQTGFHWMSPIYYRELDKESNTKPYMFMFTGKSCEDCRNILAEFKQEHPAFLNSISSQFNAILVLDDFNVMFGSEYAPGGHSYIPRVIFADPDGTIRTDMRNPRSVLADDWYHYGSAREVLWGMLAALKEYNAEQEPYPSDLDSDLP
ncbi:hypothetical protein QJQ45_016592 [Haematococcus lacustris]|nr:hypothetical protein QJQ45_016592 [Haematococcus lacustris]